MGGTRRTEWDRNRVITALRDLAAQGGTAVPMSLGKHCREFFGTVRKARAAAGIVVVRAPARPPRQWTRERVIAELQDAAARKSAISARLRTACKKFFGSVDDAWGAAAMSSEAAASRAAARKRDREARERRRAETSRAEFDGGSPPPRAER